MIGHFCNRKRRHRKTVELSISLKTNFGKDQSKQITEKHIHRKLAAIEDKLVPVLPNFIRIKYGECLCFQSVEISVGDDRAREIVGVRRELLRKLHSPLVSPWISYLAQPQPRAGYVVVSDLYVMIRARQRGQPAMQIVLNRYPATLQLAFLALALTGEMDALSVALYTLVGGLKPMSTVGGTFTVDGGMSAL